MTIENVILPSHGADKAVDVTITDNKVTSITPSLTQHTPPSLLLPALCHPHLHLDKAYLLTSNNATYEHLAPRTGSFAEALTNTAKAKALYTEEDLHLRGSQLLSTIHTQGATTARVFVEVDAVTGTLPLVVAQRLKQDFAHLVELQIVAFAQEPLFSRADGEVNLRVLEEVLASEAIADIAVLGTTPYVEADREASQKNIAWAIRTAIDKHLHLDFHLDYNLSPAHIPPSCDGPESTVPLTHFVAEQLISHDWVTLNSGRTVVLGHCTQLTQLSPADLLSLAQRITSHSLPIHFVGLPTSDIFMMGRSPSPSSCLQHPRGTLPIPALIGAPFNLSCCLGVNNVGNAFTPFGTGDPLALASWGVGLYQAAAEGDAELLYGCVSWRARRAIGLSEGKEEEEGREMEVAEGMSWGRGMLLVKNQAGLELPAPEGEGRKVMTVPARQRRSVRDVVWDPPETVLRRVVR